MAATVFIGDELTAAGFRLAGARVRVPEDGEATRLLEQARGEAELVLITAACARGVDPATLSEALMAARPLVVVVPDAAGIIAPPDLAARMLATLGIET
jgi:vacuolar-type H+-ATPase subunit F/Vma7